MLERFSRFCNETDVGLVKQALGSAIENLIFDYYVSFEKGLKIKEEAIFIKTSFAGISCPNRIGELGPSIDASPIPLLRSSDNARFSFALENRLPHPIE